MTYRKNKPVKLLQIARVGDISTLKAPDIVQFLHNEHEGKREAILRFASGEIDQHAAGDLRVFLEVEIGYRFAKHLVGVHEENLSDRIDRLCASGAVAGDTTNEAHDWREILNPTHHTCIDYRRPFSTFDKLGEVGLFPCDRPDLHRPNWEHFRGEREPASDRTFSEAT